MRLRIGVGRSEAGADVTGHVLGRFSAATVTTFSPDHYKRPGCGCYGS